MGFIGLTGLIGLIGFMVNRVNRASLGGRGLFKETAPVESDTLRAFFPSRILFPFFFAM